MVRKVVWMYDDSLLKSLLLYLLLIDEKIVCFFSDYQRFAYLLEGQLSHCHAVLHADFYRVPSYSRTPPDFETGNIMR